LVEEWAEKAMGEGTMNPILNDFGVSVKKIQKFKEWIASLPMCWKRGPKCPGGCTGCGGCGK
jgi:hypothetical protein